jgi:hypothetical protein
MYDVVAMAIGDYAKYLLHNVRRKCFRQSIVVKDVVKQLPA